MKLDDLTIGEVKQLASLFQGGTNLKNPTLGKYCIVRCYSAGVHAGFVESVDGNQ